MTVKQTKARKALLDSATLLLANNPGATFIEIAEAAGIGRATLYRHFPTREDLIRALSLAAIEATDEATSHIMDEAGNARDALRLTFEAMIDVGDRFYFLTRLPELEDEEIKSHLKRQESELFELILWAQHEKVIDPAVPASWTNAVVDGLIYAAWEMRAKGELDKERLVDLSMRTLEQGLGRKPE